MCLPIAISSERRAVWTSSPYRVPLRNALFLAVSVFRAFFPLFLPFSPFIRVRSKSYPVYRSSTWFGGGGGSCPRDGTLGLTFVVEMCAYACLVFFLFGLPLSYACICIPLVGCLGPFFIMSPPACEYVRFLLFSLLNFIFFSN